MTDDRGGTAAALVVHLHAHLPEVRGPAPHAFEDWYFEALQGSYLPLLQVLKGWAEDAVPARLSLSLSAPLLAMLRDPELNHRAEDRWQRCLTLVRREPVPDPEGLAHGYERALTLRRAFPDPCAALAELEEAGVVELGTTGVSHGFLPFLDAVDSGLVNAQVELAVRRHAAVFGRPPAGFWVPECAWTPRLDRVLAEHRVAYGFCEADGARDAVFGTAQPMVTPSGPVVFPRDPEAARDVWDPSVGYPSHAAHRDFHRDLGRELEPEVLRRYGLPADHRPLNLKAWAVSGSEDKQPYDRTRALDVVADQAQAFLAGRTAMAQRFSRATGRPAVITAPYDAELFGHWWAEGPEFLDQAARTSPSSLRWSRPSDVIRSGLAFERRGPRLGSWGQEGYGRTWLGFDNAWVQDEVAASGRAVLRMARAQDPRTEAAAEHHLLACASDWPFILRAGSHVDAVTARIRAHARAALRVEKGEDLPVLGTFGSIDPQAFLRSPNRSE
jgi:1,4-alpha-glucan branching enzyme